VVSTTFSFFYLGSSGPSLFFNTRSDKFAGKERKLYKPACKTSLKNSFFIAFKPGSIYKPGVAKLISITITDRKINSKRIFIASVCIFPASVNKAQSPALNQQFLLSEACYGRI
jgi:hypothetical protein